MWIGPTARTSTSQTITRFNIEGTDVSASLVSGTNRIFIFGETIGVKVNYNAADPAAWSTTANGETGLQLNFYTNAIGSNVFVNPPGITHFYFFQCRSVRPTLQGHLELSGVRSGTYAIVLNPVFIALFLFHPERVWARSEPAQWCAGGTAQFSNLQLTGASSGRTTGRCR